MALDQDEYQQRYDILAKRYKVAAMRVTAIETECATRKAQQHSIDIFLESLMDSGEVVSKFAPELWNATVDYVTINEKGIVTFTFRNQMEITA